MWWWVWKGCYQGIHTSTTEIYSFWREKWLYKGSFQYHFLQFLKYRGKIHSVILKDCKEYLTDLNSIRHKMFFINPHKIRQQLIKQATRDIHFCFLKEQKLKPTKRLHMRYTKIMWKVRMGLWSYHMKHRSCFFPRTTVPMFLSDTLQTSLGYLKRKTAISRLVNLALTVIPVLCLPLRLALKKVWIACLNRDNSLLFPILLSLNEQCLQHHRGLKKKSGGGGRDKHLNKGIRYFQPRHYKVETGISNRITF